MRRKPQGLEDVVNDADLNKCENKGKPKKEQNSVQKEKWAEKHGAMIPRSHDSATVEQYLQALIE
jgi:hypothetical protein